MPTLPPDLAARVRAALERGHGPDCHEGDETGPGRCRCEQADLAVEIQRLTEEQGA